MTDNKEFAKQMRENAVKNEQGNIVCSPELWEEIASVIERAIIPPCKVGDKVYKICPKCNENHNGSCKHCAWSGCLDSGCDIGVRVYSDGSFNQHDLQIVPYKVTEHRYITILKYWNLMFFANIEEAEKGKNEYDKIRNIKDRKERYEKYLLWETSREQHWSFLERGEQ